MEERRAGLGPDEPIDAGTGAERLGEADDVGATGAVRAGRPAGGTADAGDAGMIGSELEEPGPGRDSSLDDAAAVETVGMSAEDPLRTRLGAQEAGATPIGGPVEELSQAEAARGEGTPAEQAAVQAETVGMSEGDPLRTRLGVRQDDAVPIGAAAPEFADLDAGDGDEGMIGSSTQEPGPGRDTRLGGPDTTVAPDEVDREAPPLT